MKNINLQLIYVLLTFNPMYRGCRIVLYIIWLSKQIKLFRELNTNIHIMMRRRFHFFSGHLNLLFLHHFRRRRVGHRQVEQKETFISFFPITFWFSCVALVCIFFYAVFIIIIIIMYIVLHECDHIMCGLISDGFCDVRDFISI